MTLEQEVKQLRRVVETLIYWLPQSANSPIRPDEASKLIAMLRAEK